MVRILIADDHHIVRVGLVALLNRAGLTVVGEVENGQDIHRLVGELDVNVLLLDLQMPHLPDPAALVRHLKRTYQVKVVVLTGKENDALMYEMVRAGVDGYLLKDGQEDIRVVVKQVAEGQPYFPTQVKDKVFQWLTPHICYQESAPDLTPREREILTYIGRAWSNEQIAAALALEPTTIRNYASRIYTKLGVGDRVAAALYAREHGFV